LHVIPGEGDGFVGREVSGSLERKDSTVETVVLPWHSTVMYKLIVLDIESPGLRIHKDVVSHHGLDVVQDVADLNITLTPTDAVSNGHRLFLVVDGCHAPVTAGVIHWDVYQSGSEKMGLLCPSEHLLDCLVHQGTIEVNGEIGGLKVLVVQVAR
jgi:hypothetical protein